MKKIAFIALLFFSGSTLSAQQIEESTVDSLVQQTLSTFNVPGIAVGIVKDNQVILAKGYGIADLNRKNKVYASTNFGIASNSKAFTTSALAMLVDEGKINWDDRVQKYIPEFKLYNDYVSQNFTIRDLLTHRSGLGLGAGDLMIWPDGHDFTPKDIIHNIQYLKPTSGFRTKYDYDNLLYIIAGEILEKVSGQSWQKFIQNRIFNPLGMNHSAPNWNLLQDRADVISPHVPLSGKNKVRIRYTNTILDAAGGIYSNVEDLNKWMIFHLNNGEHHGKQLISKKQLKELTSAQTIMPVRTTAPYYSLFKNYGLGFVLTDVVGKMEVSHTGGLEGIVTQIVMLPQLKLGIVVLTNQQEGAAFSAISNSIKDFYLGIPDQHWITTYEALIAKNNAEADLITQKTWQIVDDHKNTKHLTIKGKYLDNWLGEVSIHMNKNGKLTFASKRSPQLTGELFYYQDNTYTVKWDNRFMYADAFVYFDIQDHQVNGFRMKPISPQTDFSFDFQDLNFKKQTKNGTKK
ncbi:serine hydrolase [Sphingobacterium faecium NBRC 15299]|uniref:serine hydrolase n=1 Tax=Sphingobacterium faecium TaxID=34087 RepID=UPI000D3AE8BB|nr:serine hydrolase [Sphingobacterium faecium]PTX11502.1 CubicO group peptidase (beta-lactamase class C family) [Sphingobacterium faecium]GEM64627.1 serine hydrolase [Sphingobacterium faecium NBRC 15299]